MPKLEIDYSNTIIYKITCKDESIKEVYVGHTTNFVQRKHLHKNCSYNISNKLKLYETIRKYGGWNNWTMEIISFFNCLDNYEARKKEQEYFESLNATLNSIEPFPKKKNNLISQNKEDAIVEIQQETETSNSTNNFECKCGKKYKDRSGLWKHNKKCNANSNSNSNKLENYECSCGKTYKIKQNLENHFINCDLYQKLENNIKKENNCNCGKKYKNRSGLWKHQKICDGIKPTENNKLIGKLLEVMKEKEEAMKEKENNSSAMILELIKQNQDFKTMMIDQSNKMIEMVKETNNFTTINNTNNTNNFNLNMFLNEKCSNAMNIMDFVDSLKFQLDDLDNTAKLGYVNGISKIFVRGLNELDVYERPIHCSDLKRETIYIKDNNVWEKDEDKEKVKKAIKHISGKNFKQINEWVKENPESKDVKTKKHEEYVKILTKCTGGIDNEEDEKFFSKIIKNITKEIVINKNNE